MQLTTSDEMGDHYNNILNTLGQYIYLLRELQISATIAVKRGAPDLRKEHNDALELQKVSYVDDYGGVYHAWCGGIVEKF